MDLEIRHLRLIAEISDELRKEGLLEGRFETVEGLLDGLERTSSHLAITLNLPPVDIPSLRREWTKLKEEAQAILDQLVVKLAQLKTCSGLIAVAA